MYMHIRIHIHVIDPVSFYLRVYLSIYIHRIGDIYIYAYCATARLESKIHRTESSNRTFSRMGGREGGRVGGAGPPILPTPLSGEVKRGKASLSQLCETWSRTACVDWAGGGHRTACAHSTTSPKPKRSDPNRGQYSARATRGCVCVHGAPCRVMAEIEPAFKKQANRDLAA